MITKICFEIQFNTHTVERTIDYPLEDKITIEIKHPVAPITVEKILCNGMTVNPYYNTSFTFANSDVQISSVHTIEKAGTYTLQVDDAYIRSQRSNLWHCSTHKEDFIFQYEFTNNNFSQAYSDRDHKGFKDPFVPCFGCSYTYGSHLPNDHSWPYLLSKHSGKNYLNLGVGGSGIDGIYNNLKLLHQQHRFDEAVILFPNFERRILRHSIGEQWLRLFTSVDLDSVNESFHFYSDPTLRSKQKSIKRKIVKDQKNTYSKRFLDKILLFCNTNKIKLFCSSWDETVYKYLRVIKKYNHANIELLPQFPDMDTFAERAGDGQHPHTKHYQLFAEQIGNFAQKY